VFEVNTMIPRRGIFHEAMPENEMGSRIRDIHAMGSALGRIDAIPLEDIRVPVGAVPRALKDLKVSIALYFEFIDIVC
jgi:hypothetical protein